MKTSYDVFVHKEIVRRLKVGGYQVTDGQTFKTSPTIIIYECEEVSNDTKTSERNTLRYTLKVWGSANGSSLEIKTLKREIIKLLTEEPYFIEGLKVEHVDLSNTVTFKEVEGQGSANHYYQCILYIDFIIEEE